MRQCVLESDMGGIVIVLESKVPWYELMEWTRPSDIRRVNFIMNDERSSRCSECLGRAACVP
jgi:hypothetical protein